MRTDHYRCRFYSSGNPKRRDEPLDGYALEDCGEVFGGALEYPVSWQGNTDLSQLAGNPIRVLREADLYSLRFAP